MAAMAGVWAALIVRGGVPEMFYMGLTLMICPWGLALYLGSREVPVPVVGPAYQQMRFTRFGAQPPAGRSAPAGSRV
jgi:hypothetical protein